MICKMPMRIFALFSLLFGIREEIEISRAKKNLPEPFDHRYDMVAAEKYLRAKNPKTFQEAERMRDEAVRASMFPPKFTKEWYDEHPREKEFYKEYYERTFK